MKTLLLFSTLVFFLTSKQDCNKNKIKNSPVYLLKGRLEVKGMCMNYTIRVIEGAIDSSLIQRNWTDEMTGKVYHNVFALGSPCNFPSTIAEGEEFSFRVDTSKQEHCAVCLAYYPKPEKRLSIICTDK